MALKKDIALQHISGYKVEGFVRNVPILTYSVATIFIVVGRVFFASPPLLESSYLYIIIYTLGI